MSRDESDSAASSGEEDEIKLTTPPARLEEILKRARQIVPWFKRYDLIRIFKEYYQNQSLLFTKLNTIANSQVKKGDDGWITQKKHTQPRPKANKIREEREGDAETKLKDYSFLKDEKLLRRLGKEDNELHPKDHRQFKEDYNHPRYQKNSQHTQNYERNRDNRQNKKDSWKSNRDYDRGGYEETYQQKNRKQVRYVEKEEEGKEAPKVESKAKGKKKFAEKSESAKEIVPAEVKIEEDNKTSPAITPEVIAQNKTQTVPIPKVQTKKETEKEPVISSPNKPQPQSPQPSPTKQEEIGLDIDSSTKQTFQRVCRQNPYILPFILPSSKPQRIQYILDNKKLSNVKVRVVTDVQ